MHETSHQPLLSILSSVVEVVVRLRSQGHKVVLVSSGAIAVGLQRMSMPSKPKSLSGKQVSVVTFPRPSHRNLGSTLGAVLKLYANMVLTLRLWRRLDKEG